MTLQEYFDKNQKFALAFSGGTDSAFLLYAALRAGCDVRPYFMRTQLQPRFELEDAERLCHKLGVSLTVLMIDAANCREIAENGRDRCYYCKRLLFERLTEKAKSDGYTLVVDGTNASDKADDRPGMLALSELNVKSPLRECGVTKSDVRRLSRETGLFTADKPSYACLATRIRTGENITSEKLNKIEAAENELIEIGFSDLRIRISQNRATLQLPAGQHERAKREWPFISAAITKYFSEAELDQNPRQET